jgi:hypothetical protein
VDDIILQCKKDWRSAGRKELANFVAAENDSRRHRKVGIPSVILSAVVATAVFASLSESVNFWIKVATGFIAIVSAILTALQTFLAYSDRAEKHLAAAIRFAKVRRDLDVLVLQSSAPAVFTRDQALEALKTIGEELSLAEKDTPPLSRAEYFAGAEGFDKTHPL